MDGHALEDLNLGTNLARHDEVRAVAAQRLVPEGLARGGHGRRAEATDQLARRVLEVREGGVGAVEGAQPHGHGDDAFEGLLQVRARHRRPVPVQGRSHDRRAMRVIEEVRGVQLAGRDRVLHVVHRVGDVVRQVHDLGLQASPPRRRPLAHPREHGRVVGVHGVLARRLGQVRAAGLDPRVLADRVQGRSRQVEARGNAARADDLGLQARDDTQGLGIALEPADRGGRRVERALAVMPEGRMAEVVGQTRRVHDIRVGPQFLAELAAHLGDLEGVREAGAHEVVRDRAQHLRLFAEATQRRGVEDARAVALKLGALGGLVVLGHPALGIGGRVRTVRVATINTGDRQGKLIHGAMLLGKRLRRTSPGLVTVKAPQTTDKIL